MVNEITQEKAEIIFSMEKQLKSNILKDEPHKLWDESFIKKQIVKRKLGEPFTLQDHIRAMVYSMLSSGNKWGNIAKDTDSVTGCIPSVDRIFCNYDIEKLKDCTPEQLREDIKKIHCGTQSTLKQMEALCNVNIPQLLKFKEYGHGMIDTYYQKFIDTDDTLKTLVIVLSTSGSIAKLEQMNVALVCEYLRNIGYDIPKPDRHICRILGSEHLALSDKKDVPPFEAFDIVVKLAEMTSKPTAEVDYILWSYCADGYGEICRKKNAKCKECVARKHCKKSEKGRD